MQFCVTKQCYRCQVLRECAIGILTAGMSTRAVAREFDVNFSVISHLQRRFRDFSSKYKRPYNRRPRVWRHVGERFAEVNVVEQMVVVGLWYGQVFPANSHSHWRGVWQHSTGHNQQPDQLYVKEMCCAVWGKWWSHQTLTGFLIHAPTVL